MKRSVPFSTHQAPRRHARFLWFFIAIVVCLGLLGIWYKARQKSLGTIIIGEPIFHTEGEEKIESIIQYQGKFFTFLYPSSFEPRLDDQDVKFPILERQLLSRSDLEGQKIAIVVQEHTGNQLSEYGAYRLREERPEVYSKEKFEKNGLEWTLFTTKSSVFESGAFVLLNRKVVSIVFSSPFQMRELQDELLKLISTFEVRSNL
ncbi:MAG: hypothetical protein E6P95_03850 [Candidatus Moraniibacteriota bacterium]|nr:MAG: hypothetical protein E6P95_03850 [Candidatus Moranbacteria bacterium]